ncbi:hypothetical protein [Legionella fallonii]|uniref:LidA long coiled-coil domain-containing protein n=1 Tax=Legionella fallonii LLAP-10 TaxID=1212491 RepID=A0A098G1V3_9GAMM|nr:hypothetical protein [Legionella fallonii]CEG56457.1 protein of unknown function [Legionella fallonii LLAP-10]
MANKESSTELTSLRKSAVSLSDNAQKIADPKKAQHEKEMKTKSPLDKWADLIYKNIDKEVKAEKSATPKDLPSTKGELSSTPKEQSPTITLSRFGIKSPKDVAIFLRSPAGDSLISEIGMKMAEERSLEEYHQLELREQQMLMKRMQAAFFHWYLEKKAHAHDKQKEIVLEQNKKAIKDSAKTSTPPAAATKASNVAQRAGLMQSINDYEQALQNNKEKEKALIKEREGLDEKLDKLNAEGELITFKYNVYDAQLADFESVLGEFEKLIDTDPKAAHAHIQPHLDNIRNKMDEYLLHVEDLIKDNQDEEASILMKMHTALGLKIASHHDMVAVKNKDKYYVGADGKEVDSFKEAHYVLNTHKNTNDEALKAIAPELRRERIHKDENKNYYLLKPGQTWDSIKDNIAEKAEAHKRFKHREPELMIVKNLVHHNKKLETEVHKEQVEDVQGQIKTNEKEKQLANNQKNIIESSLARDKQMLQQLDSTDANTLNTTSPTLTPRPTVTGGPSAPQPSKASAAHVYKEKIDLVKQMSKVTPEQLLNLADQAPGVQRVPARNFLMSEIERRNLPRTAPIPYQTMQFLLKNLERFGVDATKPSVTNIKNPTEIRKETEQVQEARTAPTPFSIKPPGF